MCLVSIRGQARKAAISKFELELVYIYIYIYIIRNIEIIARVSESHTASGNEYREGDSSYMCWLDLRTSVAQIEVGGLQRMNQIF